MSTIVYGASDDLIEIDGDISEEFSSYDEDGDGALLAFSTGTVLRVKYDKNGVWRITPVVGPPCTIVQAPEDDEDNYSDRATIEGATWVVLGTAIAT